MEKVLYIIILLALICLSEASYLEDVCAQPKDEGESCGDGAEPKKFYYFDDYDELCRSFMYKGCKGSANKFNTSDECIDSCQMAWLLKKNKKEKDPDADIKKLRKKSDCLLMPEKGKCKALITLWFYSPVNETCLVFGYGGCNGNFNRFDTEKECREFCCMDAGKAVTPSNVR